MSGSRFGFNASRSSSYTRSAISDNSRALPRRPSLFSSVAYVLSPLSPSPHNQSSRREESLIRRGDSLEDSKTFASSLVKGPGREASPQGGPRLRSRLWVVCRGGRADGLGGACAEQSVIGYVRNGFGSGRLSLLPNRPRRQPSPQGRPRRREELPDGLGVGRLGFLPVRAVSIRVLDTSQIHDRPEHGEERMGGGWQLRLITWLGSGSWLLACAAAGSFPFVLDLDLTILTGLGLLDSLSGSS